MPSLQPVLFIIGVLFAILAVFMLVPLLTAGLYDDAQEMQVFFFSMGLAAMIGGILILTQRQNKSMRLNVKQGFLTTGFSLITLCFVACIPFYMSPALELTFIDALFESTSGLTTTGATVLYGLDEMPRGILVWRSLLQWLGGVGILATALIALPLLQVGGMQLFRMEFDEKMEKALPRPAQIGFRILGIYMGLTILCALLYWMSGMGLFDAVNHSLTTVATGGYSTHDESIGYYKNDMIYLTSIVFMILGSLPFLIFFEALRNNFKKVISDSQVQTFLALLFISWGVLYYYLHGQVRLIDIVFNVTSIFTGTGFSTLDYTGWGGLAVVFFFFIMFIGGCSGSTTCGLKVFRLQVLYTSARSQLKQLMRPNGVYPMSYQGQRLNISVVQSVMGFFFLYMLSFAVLAALLGSTGMNFIAASSSAASAIANVGPGLGQQVGPSSNFGSLSDSAKWYMSIGMIIGRLELFTIFVLFMPSFWRK